MVKIYGKIKGPSKIEMQNLKTTKQDFVKKQEESSNLDLENLKRFEEIVKNDYKSILNEIELEEILESIKSSRFIIKNTTKLIQESWERGERIQELIPKLKNLLESESGERYREIIQKLNDILERKTKLNKTEPWTSKEKFLFFISSILSITILVFMIIFW